MSTAEVLSSANALLAEHAALLQRVRATQRVHRAALQALPSPPEAILNLPLIPTPPSPPRTPTPPTSTLDTHNRATLVVQNNPRVIRNDLPPAKKARAARYRNYVPEEETIRNDYSQRYVDGGEWPQDWVVGAEMERRFEEYPKQQRLLQLKKASVAEYALPPAHLSLAASRTALQNLKFDVILIDPPFSSSFTWEQLEALPVAALAADPSFVFLWVGSGAGEGLERGREILGKWGYRRCEDICWVRTNREGNKGPGTDPPTTSLLTRTKQHCLMGIRGTVRRSSDSWFVHCNIDTDVIFWEGDSNDPTRKPPEMYQLIENFCLGTRRLEIFGRYHSLRRGWVTVTAEELMLSPEEAKDKDSAVPFDREKWDTQIKEMVQGGKCVVPNTPEIESLRPKSPTPRGAGGAGGMASSSTVAGSGLPNHPSLPQPQSMGMKSMGGGGGLSGGVTMGPSPSPNFTHTMAQPMNMMSMPHMGGMGGNMGGMGGMSGMGNMGGMGNAAMNWSMGGGGGMGGAMGGGMGGGGVGRNMGNLPINAMGMPMGTPMVNQGNFDLGYAFESASGPGPGMMGMGSSMNMNIGGRGNMGGGPGLGMGAQGAFGQGAMNFGQHGGNPASWMSGADFDGRSMGPDQQNFMAGGGMWDGGESEAPMRLAMGGMGMGQWGGGFR